MNSPAYFEIQCNDLDRGKTFYGSIFGWTFARAEWAPIEYWEVTTSGIRGALLPRPVEAFPTESGTNAAVISMEVTSFDRTAEVILENGGQVGLGKFAVPGRCWQGYFIDPEGNVFGIFEADPNAA